MKLMASKLGVTDLEEAAAEHCLVEKDGVCHQRRLGELDVGVSAGGAYSNTSARNRVEMQLGDGVEQQAGLGRLGGAYPFGPVNLSKRMVTRLMVPHEAK